MFKKQPSSIKTTAPLRASDRRKLRQRVLETYSTSPELGDLLVPDGIMSQRMKTYTNEPVVLYSSPEGDPLWFTIGRESDALIPTVYTLWKKYDLLPRVATPASVIPILVGGADLMNPGVIQVSSTAASPSRLVSVVQCTSGSSTCGPPLAVGRLAVDLDTLKTDCKGKAVNILHAWKDYLFTMGTKCDPPGEMEIEEIDEGDMEAPISEPTVTDDSQASIPDDVSDPIGKHRAADESSAPLMPDSAPNGLWFSKEEVSEILRVAVLQAISTTLESLTSASFPLPASTFYSSYVLPFRPAFVGNPLSDEQVQSSLNEASSPYPPIDIKHSGHKSLLAFFKLLDKQQILDLKDTKPEPLVLNVSTRHPDVLAHRPYTSLQDMRIKKEKRDRREEEERKKVQEIEVKEFWIPYAASGSTEFFIAGGFDSSARYSYSDLKATVNRYVAAHQLTNPQNQTYVNVGIDEVLFSVCAKNAIAGSVKFLKREDVVKRLSEKMQSWYDLRAAGKEPVLKKGQLKPISVVVKSRQGKKARTLVTGFEPFFVEAQEMAHELRRLCASATCVYSEGHGKPSGPETVLVQGKQIKKVTEFLLSRGVPKKWIESTDLSRNKKTKADCAPKPGTKKKQSQV